MVKFSSTLFIIYFSGRCFSLWMKLIMYSEGGAVDAVGVVAILIAGILCLQDPGGSRA